MCTLCKLVLSPNQLDQSYSEVIRVAADHSEVCKPLLKNDVTYRAVADAVRAVLDQH